MNRFTTWLNNFRLKSLLSVVLTALAFLVIPAFSYSPSLSAQAEILVANQTYDSYIVDPATVKKIQDKAEDINSDKIGDTGLKNIRKLGENIPETIDLNVRNSLNLNDPNSSKAKNTAEEVKSRVKGAVKDTKRALKDATS